MSRSVVFFLAACSQTKLEKEQAVTVIRAGKEYPKVYEYDANVTDPASAKKLLDVGVRKRRIVAKSVSLFLYPVVQPSMTCFSCCHKKYPLII